MAESNPPTLDGGILLTFLFSIGIAGWVFLLFFFIRKKLPFVYFPIEQNNPQQKTYFNWLIPTLKLTNEEILPRSGLIGSLYLEWKYFCSIFLCFVCVITLPLLISLYYTHTDQIFFAGMAASALGLLFLFLFLFLFYFILLFILFIIIYLFFYLFLFIFLF